MGWWLRIAVGATCVGCAILAINSLRGSATISKLDIAIPTALVVTLALMALPGRVATRMRQNATKLAVGMAIAAALLESYVRVFDPFPILLRAGRIDLPANQKKQFSSGGMAGLEATISVTFNSLGFRGPEPPQKWSEHFTIICVGGSTTQCLYLSDGKTWPDQLASKLAHDFENVWVNNAGIDGHSTFGHLELLNQYLGGLRPKFLLFYVGLNDVDRHDLNLNDQSSLRSQARQNDSLARSFQRFLLRRSDAFALLDNLRLQWSAKQRGLTHGELMGHRQLTNDVAPKPLSRMARQQWLQTRDPSCLAGYEARLRAIVERCRELQIECALATQPVLYGNGVDDITGIDLESIRVGEVDGATQWELLQRYNQITLKVGQDLIVPVIDVADRLPKSSLYFYDLTHYNIEGAKKVATIMYEDLSRHLAISWPPHHGN